MLSCLLGVTWILGVFYVDADTIGFAYVFTLLNAMQVCVTLSVASCIQCLLFAFLSLSLLAIYFCVSNFPSFHVCIYEFRHFLTL